MKYLLAIIIFAIGITLGFFSTKLSNGSLDSNKKSSEIRLEDGFKFVNPLLECEQGPNYLSRNSIKPFKPVIEKVVEKAISENRIDYVSVYFRDLNNGTWFSINESEKFFPASLMKLPLLIYFLRETEISPGTLQAEVEYVSGQEATPQFFKPDNPVKVGETYTINELLERAVTQSDNSAALLLFQIADKNKFEKVFPEFGIDPPKENGQDYLNVKSYAAFFRILFNASYLSHEYSEFALNLLSKVKFNSGLNAKLPKSVVVSHKFGESQDKLTERKQLHDCGIVYYPNKPYLICLMTRGTNFDQMAGVIADISKATYDEVDRQQKAN